MRRLLPCLLLAVACRGVPAPDPVPDAGLTPTRGIILISIDTLRADRLGAYGYDRPTTPWLDRLADRGVVFEQAWAQLPGTLPSHMSMMTGLYPQEHGVYPPASILSSRIPTLAERLSGRGFRTFGHTEGGFVHGGFGFARGFDEFDHSSDRTPRAIEDTVDRALRSLRSVKAEERFFLFLHTYATHDPYDPPEPQRSLFAGPEPATAFFPSGPNLVDVNRSLRAVDDATRQWFCDLYDGGVRFADDVLGELFDWLDDRQLWSEVTLIVTSDHGEEFLEHGGLVHEQLYPETLRVPLIIAHPQARPGSRVAALVESVDLAPTILELSGIEPASSMSGRSLAGCLRDPSCSTRPAAWAEDFSGRSQTLVVDHDDTLKQLLFTQGPRWWRLRSRVGRRTEFDHAGPELEFSVGSLGAPRRVIVQVDGLDVGQIEVTGGWRRHRFKLSPGRHRVLLLADGCAEIDGRCLSYQLRGLELNRTELFDLGRDPSAAFDESRAHPSKADDLARRVMERRFSKRHEPESTVEDTELAERLRSLGYLR